MLLDFVFNGVIAIKDDWLLVFISGHGKEVWGYLHLAELVSFLRALVVLVMKRQKMGAHVNLPALSNCNIPLSLHSNTFSIIGLSR